MIRVGSLFSGVGGFDMGLEAAGMKIVWQVEIDPQARAVLRRHWSDVDLHEDVRNVGSANLAPVDVICGGFPCQDLSVAGRRAGLAGERSGLFYEFMRVVAELAPRWVLIENVPGLLSSNGGRDMGAVVGTLAELGYGWTYRVLDLQHFGVPQRRRRVFIVGRAGGFCPPEILLEPESLPGDPPARGEAGQRAAALPAIGAGTARTGNERTEADLLIAGTVAAKWAKGTGGPAGDEVQNIVAHTLALRGRDGGATAELGGNVATALRASQGGGDKPHVLAPQVAHTLRAEGYDASEDGTGRGTPIVPAVAFNCKQAAEDAGDPAPTLRAMPHDASHPNGGGQVAVYQIVQSNQGGGGNRAALNPGEPHQTLHTGSPNSIWTESQPSSCREDEPAYAAIPRRLTPRECERLMGWPDDWTRYGITDDGREVEMKDGPRYRMCGNGVGAPVAEWIGRRIGAAEAQRRQRAA